MAELAKARVVPVGQAFLFGQLPEPLDEVEVRAVGGQIQQFDVAGSSVRGDLFAALVACVVQDQRDGTAGMHGADLLQQLFDQCRADGALRAHADDLVAVALDGPQHAVVLPARRGLDPPRPLLEVVGDGVGVQLEAFGNEAVFGPLAVHAYDQQLDAVFVTQRWIVHRIFKVADFSLREGDAGHGLCPSEDNHASQHASLLFHKS